MQILIPAMHRSMTSVLARLLNLSGAYFGAKEAATDANAENPKGFWERKDARRANDHLLMGAGFDWWRVRGLNVSNLPENLQATFHEEASRVVTKLDGHRPWVLKEPRLCLLLPLWLQHLEQPVAVVIHRHPVSVARSLEKRNGFPLDAGIALWERYTLDTLNHSRGIPRVLVAAEALISDPVSTLRNLLSSLAGAGARDLSMPSGDAIHAFIEPSFVHHGSGDEGPLTRPQAELHAALWDGSALKRDWPGEICPEADAALEALEKTYVPPPPRAKKRLWYAPWRRV